MDRLVRRICSQQTTPAKINYEVRQFCRSLSPLAPRFVPVEPRPGTEARYCYLNTLAASREQGGKAVYGWVIWYWPRKLIEAEYHSVWEKTDGSLSDPTPTIDGEPQVLFLSDPQGPHATVKALLDRLEEAERIGQGVIDGTQYTVPNVVWRLNEKVTVTK